MERDPAYAAQSDGDLVAAIGALDESALGEIYQRHAGAVFGLAARVLVERTHAEEIVQEVFLRLWEHPERFDRIRGSLRAFLLMETHARSVDRIRAEERRRDREQRALRDTETSYDLDLELRDLTIAEQIRAAVAELTDQEREAIELAYFGGKTYRQVALLLEQPEGTIKSRIRTGLMRLRHRLIEQGIDESWIPS
ncbi:MAG TPA: sigma-70 family RNA polymerase sigma factor [Acidimicrobiia bacterium]|nr:sigma-70 family RNA polymerase sigma factor [Acidimicrobiia bacterium]